MSRNASRQKFKQSARYGGFGKKTKTHVNCENQKKKEMCLRILKH